MREFNHLIADTDKGYVGVCFENGDRELWYSNPRWPLAVRGAIGDSTDRDTVTKRVGAEAVRLMKLGRDPQNLICTQLEEDRIAAFVRTL